MLRVNSATEESPPHQILRFAQNDIFRQPMIFLKRASSSLTPFALKVTGPLVIARSGSEGAKPYLPVITINVKIIMLKYKVIGCK